MNMTKVIDLKKSVYELVSEHPEAAGIMAAQGFSEIRKKGVLGSVGKLMTIPKGARLQDSAGRHHQGFPGRRL